MPRTPLTEAAAEYARCAHYLLRDRGSDHLVVSLHGLGGDHLQPLGLTRDALHATGISVLAPDARAHGQTPVIGPAERFTTASLADDVIALVDEIGMNDKQLIPVGISMGAAVGLHLLRRHPDRVAGVLAIRPSFETKPWPDHLRVFREIASLLRHHGPDGANTFQHGDTYQRVRVASPSAAASLLEQFAKPMAVERVVRLETVPGNVAVDWQGRLQVDCPVTVVAAAKDAGHPEYVAELWRDRIESAALVRVPSRDEDPQTYASALEDTVTACVTAWTRTSNTTGQPRRA